MGSKKNVDMSVNEDKIKVSSDSMTETNVSGENTEAVTEATAEGEVVAAAETKAKKARVRSQRYTATRAQVDKTKTYDHFAAIELVKKLSYTKFAGTITADLLLKEEGLSVTMTFPHTTGKSIRAVIVSEAVIKDIEAGKIDFDVLITEPRFMGQLAKFARVLGPKGLMPNPKNGTVTSNPELKKQELEGGKVMIKGEKKAPLMHVSIGKTDMDTKALLENLQALLAAVKGKVLKASLSASMSPSVKVVIE